MDIIADSITIRNSINMNSNLIDVVVYFMVIEIIQAIGDGKPPATEHLPTTIPEDLSQARKPPSVVELNKILKELENPENREYRAALTPEMMEARKILSKLQRRSKVPTQINLDDKVMRNLRQISNPSQLIHDIVVSFFFVFGEYEGYTRVCFSNRYLFAF